MRKLITLLALFTLALAGVAIAQTGDDAKNLKINEAIALAAIAKAKGKTDG